MSNFVSREEILGEADNRIEYITPVIIRLGTPAEICKEVKIRPPADATNFTFIASVPEEFGS